MCDYVQIVLPTLPIKLSVFSNLSKLCLHVSSLVGSLCIIICGTIWELGAMQY